jgi:hypothetical protein
MRAALSLALLLTACTDAGLYDLSAPPLQADRVALTGRVCTDDAEAARFPVKLVLLVDTAAGPLFADFDPAGERIQLLVDLVQSALTRPHWSIAVVGYAGRAEKFAPIDTPFTRNPGELLAAVTRASIPQGCVGEDRCRDIEDGLRLVRSVVEDDLAASLAGQRVLTRYVVLHLNGGPPLPLARARDCCLPGDRQCQQDGDVPSFTCAGDQLVTRVEALEQSIDAAGAAGLSLHGLQLAAHAQPRTNDMMQTIHQRLAFAGGGRTLRYDAPQGLDVTDLGLFDGGGTLRAKRLVVANLNALPGPEGGFIADSDGDGLPDSEEVITDPTRPDTDGDGVTDGVERLVGLDATFNEQPAACASLIIGADTDLDGLTDCDEALLGTDRSLVDTDGDGLPDRLEVSLGTDYLLADPTTDLDQDGVPDGEEVRERTDPRRADRAARLGDAYRYTIDDEGLVTEPVAPPLARITGVELVQISDATTAGVGVLRWTPGTPPTLAWRDASDEAFGAEVPIEADGTVQVGSGSYAEIQGARGRFVRARVRLEEVAPQPTEERVRVAFRARHCQQFTVRNVRLVETLPVGDDPVGGMNSLWIYLAQAPANRPSAPGPVRLALVPVRYLAPAFREPDGAALVVASDEYVTPRPR